MSNPASFTLTGLRRRVLLGLALSLLAGSTFAHAWPAKPFKLIVPFPAVRLA